MSRQGRYGTLWEGFWAWAKSKGLSDAAKVACCFLVSTRHGDSSGAVNLPALYLAHEQGWDLRTAESVLMEVVGSGFAIRAGDWMMVRDYPEHYPPTNPKHAAGVATRVRALPREIRAICAGRWLDTPDAREAFDRHGGKIPWEFDGFRREVAPRTSCADSPIESLSKAYRKPIESLSIPESVSESGSESGSVSESESGSEPSGCDRAALAPQPPIPGLDVSPPHPRPVAKRTRRSKADKPPTLTPEGEPITNGMVSDVIAHHEQATGLRQALTPRNAEWWQVRDRLKEAGRSRCIRAIDLVAGSTWRRKTSRISLGSIFATSSLLADAEAIGHAQAVVSTPARAATRREREGAAFDEVIAEAQERERAAMGDIPATDVRRDEA